MALEFGDILKGCRLYLFSKRAIGSANILAPGFNPALAV